MILPLQNNLRCKLNPGLSHPTSVPMSSTCQKRRCDEDPEIVSLTRRVGRIRSSRGYGNTISFDKARSRATLDENIYCAGWSVSWLYQRSLARLLAGATQHDVEKLLPYANSLPEGIEGRRRGFVQTNDDSSQRVFFSQRFSSPSFFLPFIRSFCPFVVHRPFLPLSPSVANECRSADARRSGWFDEAWWMLLESRDFARLGTCNEKNRSLNRQREHAG